MAGARPALPSDDAPRFRLPRRLSARRLAAALVEAGYAVAAVSACRHEDAYLDTQDGRLYRAGTRLRRRGPSPRWQVLERGWLVAEQGGEDDVAALLGDAAGGRRLLPQATVRASGRLLRMRTPVGAELDLAVERWSFSSPDGVVRVEGPRVGSLEAPGEVPAEAQHLGTVLRDLIGLRRLVDDPLTAALRALALPLPGAPVPDELNLAGGDTMAEAARKILARQAYRMWANAAGTIADLDPEFLHDLRVATRRARSALRLFVPLLGAARCDALRAELGWIAALLGAVRDLDVQLDRLRHDLERVGAAAGGDAGVTATLAARRRRALATLRGALQHRRFADLLATLREVRPGADAAADCVAWGAAPAVEVAPALLRRAARRVRRWDGGDVVTATDSQLHRLRILCKRLRYTSEFFADLYGEEFHGAIARLVPFQDCLGAHQDAVVALGVLSGYAERAGGRHAADARDPPSVLVTLEDDLVGAHRSHPFPKHGARSRSIAARVHSRKCCLQEF